MNSKFQKDFVEKQIFSKMTGNWYITARGFLNAGLLLIKNNKFPDDNGFINEEDRFTYNFNYKVGVYNLCHAIELLLKTIISHHNNTISKNDPLKPPEKFSHNITEMVNELSRVKAFTLDEGEKELLALIHEQLAWFGRYHVPRDVDKTLKDSFTSGDGNELISFKYEIKNPETYEKIIAFFHKYDIFIGKPIGMHSFLYSMV